MADYDRGEEREAYESPFQTLSKHIANLRIQNGEDPSGAEVDDEHQVVEVIESFCINCEENVRIPISQSQSPV